MKNTVTYFVLMLFFTLVSYGQPGILDATFATDGLLQFDVAGGHDNGHGIAVQPDGKIVVTASATHSGFSFDIVVLRLHEDGSLDTSFGDGGMYRYANANGSDLVYELTLVEDGSIFVVGGHSETPANTEMLIIKLNDKGSPDPSFGTDGVVIQTIDTSEDYAHSLAFTADGQLIVGGFSYKPGFSFKRNVLCRFDADGTLDTSFGVNGIFMWNDDDTRSEVWNIAITDDGGILASGKSTPSGTDRLSLYKVKADGSSLDSSFGTGGEVLAPFEGTAYGMIVHSNGNILLCGPSSGLMGRDLIVLAYHQNGTPNTDFGTDGIFLVNNDINDVGLNITEQSDGKIVVCGESGGTFIMPPPRAFFSVRMDENGVLDTTWGGTGMVVTDLSDLFAFANDVTMQPADGKILLTGAAAFTQNDLIVARYNNYVDADGDGFPLGEDCVDSNFDINPGAVEIPDNEIDEDCDGFDLATGIAETTLAQQFLLYPNPTKDRVYLEFTSSLLVPEWIQISAYSGKVLKTIKGDFRNGQMMMDTAEFPAGLLVFSIFTKEGVIVKRVVKQ